jgi:thioredoxin-dependent peroxiredoxin
MSVRLGEEAPDFVAQTTEGEIHFHDWLGDSWGVLFSHPADFTPVCTTELGRAAALKPEFDKRNTKIIGLSVDQLASHARWAEDIAETQGTAVNFPMIADSDRKVSLQLTAYKKVATPVDWKQGEDVVILPGVSGEEADKLFPGYRTVKPYLRMTSQPKN